MKTNKVLTYSGAIGSLLYVTVIAVWRWESLRCLGAVPLNEFGDFFAGVFGPLALFWVVLGFIQQGEELNQNTSALELQAKELHDSAEQQRLLVEASNKEVHALTEQFRKEEQRRRESEQPDFKLLKARESSAGGGKKKFEFIFVNKGPIANELRISMKPEKEIFEGNQWKHTAIDTDQKIKLEWQSKIEDIPNCVSITIDCFDSKGITFQRVFELLTTNKSSYDLTQDY